MTTNQRAWWNAHCPLIGCLYFERIELVDVEFSERSNCAVDVGVVNWLWVCAGKVVEVSKVVAELVDAPPPFFGDDLNGFLLAAPLCGQHARWYVVEELIKFGANVVLQIEKQNL